MKNGFFSFTVLVIFLTLFGSLSGNLPLWAFEQRPWYRVAPGETLDQIIKKLGLCDDPDSCKAITRKIQALNPQEVRGNRVYPYSQLLLPISELPSQSKYALTKDKEVLPKSQVTPPPAPRPSPEPTPTALASPTPEPTPTPEVSTPEALPSPTPEPTPTVQNASERTSAIKFSSSLAVQPEVSFFKLTGKDTNGSATLYSDLNYGIKVTWAQMWGSKFRSYTYAETMRINMLQPLSGKSIANPNEFHSGFGIGGEYSVTDRLSLGGSLSAREEIFYNGAHTASVNLDKVMLFEPEGYARMALLERRTFGAGIQVHGRITVPKEANGYSCSLGEGATAKLYLVQGFSRSSIGAAVSFGQLQVKSTLATQTRMEESLNLWIRWSL